MTIVLSRDENPGVAGRAPKAKGSNAITNRFVAIAKARGLSERGLCEKAGLGETTLSAARRRGSSLQLDHALQLAEALEMSIEQIATETPVDVGIAFRDLMKWATGTPGVADALMRDEHLSVADLLRYKKSPAKEGEFDGAAVLARIKSLRRVAGEPKDIAESDESKVLGPKGKTPRR